tara:strand:+ start:106 stop:573 length:468 start_codon:yes stop_codon:yes gene_type:complete
MFKLLNLKTTDLNKNLVIEILKLKNTHWKKGLNSQKNHFNLNINKSDVHILLYYKTKLSGYVLLRKKKCFFKNRRISYLHFDTLIIKKKFRNKKISPILMNFTNNFIRFKKTLSVLYCEDNLIKFYKKFKWKKISQKNFISEIRNNNKKNIFYFE